MLKSLIDWQNDHAARAAQFARHQHAGKVGLGAGGLAFVPVEDFASAQGEIHGRWVRVTLKCLQQNASQHPIGQGVGYFQLGAGYVE